MKRLVMNSTTLKLKLKSINGKITHDNKYSGQNSSWCVVEVYFTNYNGSIEEKLEQFCRNTEWELDLDWDPENNGVFFERRVE